MVRTLITSKGQTTVPVEIRRNWKGTEILWEACPDGTARVRPKQSPAARRLIGEANEGKVTLILSAVTVAAIFYALRASYKMPRAKIATLLGILGFAEERFERCLDLGEGFCSPFHHFDFHQIARGMTAVAGSLQRLISHFLPPRICR